MTSPRAFVRTAAILASLVLAQASWAQVTPGGTPPGGVPRPAPVESTPLAPLPGTGPAAPGVPSATPAPRSAASLPTLVPKAGDPSDAEEVTLPGKPAAILSGASTWDDGFTNLKNGFRKIEEELTRAAMAPAGRPVTVFLETDDMGFRYQAMIPVLEVPAGRTSLTPEIRFGTTPAGRALRFVHTGSYEEIDDTYEAITAYLDTKNLAVKDIFIEEYVSELTSPDDPNLELNIFVQPN